MIFFPMSALFVLAHEKESDRAASQNEKEGKEGTHFLNSNLNI